MKKFLKLIFSKKIIGALFLILQIVFIFKTIDRIYSFPTLIYGSATVASILAILWEINRNVSPGFKIIWIAIIGTMPFFGILLYIYVHLDIFNFGIKKKLTDINKNTKIYTKSNIESLNDISQQEFKESGIFRYLHNYSDAPCFKNTSVQYFSLGEDMYAELIKDVKKAEKFIFIEYFIINENSYMWKNLEKILIEKAENGVDVRVIYDGMGSITTANHDFDNKINKLGIKCKVFSPVKPFISSSHNNRDHRKIFVIDGKIAYTGGVNFADEYINKKERFGHWKDSAVKLQGDAVNSFSLLFLKMWELVSKEKIKYDDFFVSHDVKESNGYVSVFDDNPLDNERVSENVYLHMIDNANKYVYITTPYLILDDDLTDSLKFAAKRGVDVRITMPHIPDKWYAFMLARTYYPELIKSGVKIYEYTPGFIHAKSTVSDDARAFIGSANYDFRSLYLHYECGVYIYNNSVITELVSDYKSTLEKCHLFTLEDYKSLKVIYRLIGRIIRFFAPLM